MYAKLHIWTWGTYNSDTELKLRTEIQINIKLGLEKNISSQESGIFFIDPKLHILT